MSENLIWIKSSYSGSEGGQCVEIAALSDGTRLVRDTKNRDGGTLRFSADAWRRFTDQLKAH